MFTIHSNGNIYLSSLRLYFIFIFVSTKRVSTANATIIYIIYSRSSFVSMIFHVKLVCECSIIYLDV